jgi:hypothetical protein
VKFLSEGKQMNKLIAALIAATFALGSVAAMAQADKTPPQPVDTAKLKAEREKAKADYAAMTPEEKAAFKKGRAATRRSLLTDQEMQAIDNPPSTKAETAAVKAEKAQPKALPTKGAKQNALQGQEKASEKGGGGN